MVSVAIGWITVRGRVWAAEIGRGCVLASGVWVLVSGVAKAMDAASFERTLILQGVFGTEWAGPAAVAIACAEILIASCGLFALMCHRERLAAWCFAFMFGVFSAYLGLLWLNPPPPGVTCGCGLSRSAADSWGSLVVRNAAIAGALAAIGWRYGESARR